MSAVANLYADLSGYYDQFCAEIDYAEQSAFALRAFNCFASSGGRDYLDLACGTGVHLAHMAPHGFTLAGLDNSAAMLALAAQKVPGGQWLLADMATLDEQEKFDLITCFLYSIHYSHPLASLQETLRRIWRALKPGGVFIFNTVDVAGVGGQRMVASQVQDGEAMLHFQSGWRYSGSGEKMELRLSISRQTADHIQLWEDSHAMTALSFKVLTAMLSAQGFELTLLEHDYATMRPWDGESFNMIVVATRPGSAVALTGAASVATSPEIHPPA